uniref:GATA transcription factor 24-like isoform X6 n=1 Tax=Rhizophora mucronata TaxID=61149 RepID=A0A2P2KQV2_RHIMU
MGLHFLISQMAPHILHLEDYSVANLCIYVMPVSSHDSRSLIFFLRRDQLPLPSMWPEGKEYVGMIRASLLQISQL